MSTPNQDALALEVSFVPDLSHFVAGPNAELLDRLKRIGSGKAGFVSLHLWGEEGAGKSFLCACLRATGRRFNTNSSSFEANTLSDSFFEIHDDIQSTNNTQQKQLLQRFNQLHQFDQGLWLSTSQLPPAQLQLLPDLQSRLSWGLVYELKTLADEDKLTALQAWTQARGLPLAVDVLPWLLRHESRNLAHLTRLLLDFDRFGLQSKRSLSLPLLRQWLHEQYPARAEPKPLG